MVDLELAHPGCTKLEVVETMHERLPLLSCGEVGWHVILPRFRCDVFSLPIQSLNFLLRFSCKQLRGTTPLGIWVVKQQVVVLGDYQFGICLEAWKLKTRTLIFFDTKRLARISPWKPNLFPDSSVKGLDGPPPFQNQGNHQGHVYIISKRYVYT